MKFGISRNVKSRVVELCTKERFYAAVDDPKVGNICAQIADQWELSKRGELSPEAFETSKALLKKELPIFTPHAYFEEGRRLNSKAIPSGMCMFDIDHIPNPREKWLEILPRVAELRICLAHITPSTEGLRIFFVIPKVMGLADAQSWFAMKIGCTNYDECVKDYARSSFVVPREYILYIDEETLFSDNEAPVVATENNEKAEKEEEKEEEENEPSDKENVSYSPYFNEIPYTLIVEVLEEQMGGRPEHGSRNNFIFSMACHLRYVCNDDPKWIASIMPTYGEAREKWEASIKSACNRNQTKNLPRIMERTLSICRQRCAMTDEEDEANTPPPMPKNLPPLVKLLISRTPKIYRPAVAHAIFPSLGAHLWQTRFRYVDNVEHEATFMNVLMAGTGAGKNCISEPINYIMADIRDRDALSLKREREWKLEMQTKGANKDKAKRPEGLVIQEIDPDMTNAAFVQRLADAEGRFLYARMNEIDQFDALKSGASGKAQFQIMCLAFDPGNVYGQTRVGTSSVSERVCIRFNWNASTTILKGQRYFSRVLTDGPISRINFCTIPERQIGSEMPIYGNYGSSFAEQLRPFIENLNNARGLIECDKAIALAKNLIHECADFARLSQSRVYENLSFRANVIAYLKAMVLYVAHGCQWDKRIEDFVRWSLKYDLWCKMQFFEDDIVKSESHKASSKRGPKNLLEELPEVFTYTEAERARAKCGIRNGNATNMLNNWLQRKYIEIYGDKLPSNEKHKQQYIKSKSILKV